MKILVFAHRLEIGGTQTNAIELAAALRDFHHHDVVIFATTGPMVHLVEKKGLRYLSAPDARFHPSIARMRALRQAVRSECPDLLLVWDWWQCVDAYYAVHLFMRVPMVVMDMMMSLTRVLPTAVPTTFGVPAIVDQARKKGRRRVEFIPPPVDIHMNAPNAVDPSPFCERHGIKPSDITLVTVSRLTEWMKAESLYCTIDAVRELGNDLPLRLMIVGEGTLRPALQRRVDEVNAVLGRPAIVLAGALLDPREAYAAADIVIGMGGSALRAMAFGKPVIIVGENGFSATFSPETVDFFYYQGIYGTGHSNATLIEEIRKLAEDSEQRISLGRFSREFVVSHFALETVTQRLARFCNGAAVDKPRLHVRVVDGLRTAAVYLRERRFLCPSRSITGI
jgi:glycosyltransferase involved in cell wall biosynthesis